MRKHLLEMAIAMLTVLAIVACACRATGVRRPPAHRADGMAEAKRQGDERHEQGGDGGGAGAGQREGELPEQFVG